MSIASEITRLSGAKSSLATAIAAKGVTVPETTKLDGYAALVDDIESGGGSTPTLGFLATAWDSSGYPTEGTLYGFTNNVPAGYLSGWNSANSQFSKLVSVVLPSELTVISSQMFRGAAALALTSLPSGITSIGATAFFQCAALALTSLPSGATSIGSDAFNGCTALALTSLPSGLTTLSNNTFYDCTHLALTSLPSGLTSIGSNAFKGCTTLTKIWIPSGCTTITAATYTSSPFYLCSSSLAIYCEAASKPAGWGAYWNYYNNGATLTVNWDVSLEEFNSL